MPGHEKTNSVVAAPPSSAGNEPPSTVITGINALRNACPYSTTDSRSPLARAVLT